jgi:hypothetical protein
MKYATLNEYHVSYDAPQHTLFRILPKRRVEGDTEMMRCVIAKQHDGVTDLFVYVFNPEELTEIPDEVADIMMSVA